MTGPSHGPPPLGSPAPAFPPTGCNEVSETVTLVFASFLQAACLRGRPSAPLLALLSAQVSTSLPALSHK